MSQAYPHVHLFTTLAISFQTHGNIVVHGSEYARASDCGVAVLSRKAFCTEVSAGGTRQLALREKPHPSQKPFRMGHPERLNPSLGHPPTYQLRGADGIKPPLQKQSPVGSSFSHDHGTSPTAGMNAASTTTQGFACVGPYVGAGLARPHSGLREAAANERAEAEQAGAEQEQRRWLRSRGDCRG